jgi:thiol-disulfide isomerase/thioredoxin
MSNARHALISLLFFVAPGLATSAEPPLQVSMIPVKPRTAAPAMALKDLDGQTVDLAELRSKVVIVNFWATWCPPCRREFPSMERLRQKLANKPLVILGVNEGENIETIEQFTSTLDVWPQFPILLDLEGDAMALWPVRGLPTTFVIDKHGRMAYRAIGGREFDHPEVMKLIDSLLMEK